MTLTFRAVMVFFIVTELNVNYRAYAVSEGDLRSPNAILNQFFRMLPHHDQQPSYSHSLKPPALVPSLVTRRRRLADESTPLWSADVIPNVRDVPDSELRAKISEHRIKLARLQQESKDLAHERSFLEKTLELKKGQQNMQNGQARLSQAELEDKTKEIEMYRREAPHTLLRYNELVRKQKEMQEMLNKLHTQSEELSTSKHVMMKKLHNLRMEDLVERHARGLPDAMAGALRKSAAALIPFFDYLIIAADTNSRLVDHVGTEIDKYTHVNISGSPFMSGILFYCVLLIPLLTCIFFGRRIFDNSCKLTVSHCIILGNLYFVLICAVNVIAAIFLRDDPMNFMWKNFERSLIVGNLCLSLYYAWHVAMLGLQGIYTLERGNISQLVATITVGIHYFLFAWRRMFTDHAPMMYTFNYLVYGTIFCFILYERYSRMSNKQRNDNVVFRILHIVIKKRSRLKTWRGFKAVAAQIWESMASNSSTSRRRLPRANYKYSKSRGCGTEYHTPHRDKRKSSSISNEEETFQRSEVNETHSRKRYTGTREARHEGVHLGRRRGLFSRIFGLAWNDGKSPDELEQDGDITTEVDRSA